MTAWYLRNLEEIGVVIFGFYFFVMALLLNVILKDRKADKLDKMYRDMAERVKDGE